VVRVAAFDRKTGTKRHTWRDLAGKIATRNRSMARVTVPREEIFVINADDETSD
jgi:hypothetical protein